MMPGGMMGGRGGPMGRMPMGMGAVQVQDEDMDPNDEQGEYGTPQPQAPQPPPSMGAFAALGQRIQQVDMYFNPVLSSEPFDESTLGDLVSLPALPGNMQTTSGGGYSDPIDGSYNEMQKPDVRKQMIDFLREKAKSRLAATEQFQAAALDARNPQRG